MSWWEIAGCMIGDQPADVLEGAVNAVVPFDLARTLGAADAALRADAAQLVADPASAEGTLVAVFLDDSVVTAAAATEGVSEFAAALRKVTSAYVDRFERKPRLADVLATLAFVVRGRETEPGGGGPLLSHIAYRT